MPFPFPIIALEEHFLSDAAVEAYTARSMVDPCEGTELLRRCKANLVDVGKTRLKSMDDNGITMQVLSHATNTIALDLQTCIKINNGLASTVASRPQSFAGFATLCMLEPQAAAGELRRCVRNLGFVGALIDNNTEGKFYDDEFYWPIFQTAEELDVPIYLHPAYNDDLKPILFDGNYPDAIAQTLAMHAFGWHAENAIHLLRLFAAGLFDRFPKLKIILGHMGEMLPYQLDRIVRISSTQWPMAGFSVKRDLRRVWDENVWITTSGMFALAPFSCLLRQCKIDRILFSVDYPFARNEWGLKFLQDLKESGMVTDVELEDIAHGNARKLLKLPSHEGVNGIIS